MSFVYGVPGRQRSLAVFPSMTTGERSVSETILRVFGFSGNPVDSYRDYTVESLILAQDER